MTWGGRLDSGVPARPHDSKEDREVKRKADFVCVGEQNLSHRVSADALHTQGRLDTLLRTTVVLEQVVSIF